MWTSELHPESGAAVAVAALKQPLPAAVRENDERAHRTGRRIGSTDHQQARLTPPSPVETTSWRAQNVSGLHLTLEQQAQNKAWSAGDQLRQQGPNGVGEGAKFMFTSGFILSKRGWSALACAVLIGTLTMTAPATAQPQLSAQDSQFLQQVHQGNLAEIAAGKLAQSKAGSVEVRDLGALFVTDHTQMDAAVQQLANTLGVTLPQAPNPEQQAMQTELQNASPGTFDSTFIPGQITAHTMTMQLIQTELANGTSNDVKKAASDAAPVVQKHHDRLMAAANALGVPTSINTGNAGTVAPVRDQGLIALLIIAGVALAGVGLVGLRRTARG
jgi:putative membrane protein